MKPTELGKSIYHQSPNHINKKQESATQSAVQQIISQNPGKKNLRNPDYFSTSVISTTKVFFFIIIKICMTIYNYCFLAI